MFAPTCAAPIRVPDPIDRIGTTFVNPSNLTPLLNVIVLIKSLSCGAIALTAVPPTMVIAASLSIPHKSIAEARGTETNRIVTIKIFENNLFIIDTNLS